MNTDLRLNWMNWRALVALVFWTSIKVGGFRMEPAGRVTDEQSFP
jgi:hypothetical protein